MASTHERLLKKIKELERQNGLLRAQQEEATDLDNYLEEAGRKRKRKNPPVPLMKIRKYVLYYITCTINENSEIRVYLSYTYF